MCYSETCADMKCVLFQIACYCTTSKKKWCVLSLPQVWGNTGISAAMKMISMLLWHSPPRKKLSYGMENTVS